MSLQPTLSNLTSFDFNSFLPEIVKLRNSGKNSLSVFIINSILKHDIKPELKKILYHELGISLFYTKYKDHGLRVMDNLLLSGNLNIIEISNQSFYTSKLEIIEKIKPNIKCPLVEGTNENYKPMNPSLVCYKNGWIGLSRLVNYTQERATNFMFISKDGVCRTKIVLMIFDSKFELKYQSILEDHSGRIRYENARVKYFEDAIPFWDHSELYMLSNALDGNINGMSTIYRCKIDIENSKIVEAKELQSPYNKVEKNWLPININNEINYLYSYDPVIILDPKLNISKYDQKGNFKSFRGGGGVLNYKIGPAGGYLIIIHEVGIYPNGGRCYLHRFVWMNSKFIIEKISHSWIFEHRGIEYCRSVASNPKNDKLILGVGIEDRESVYYIIDYNTPIGMLKDLSYFD